MGRSASAMKTLFILMLWLQLVWSVTFSTREVFSGRYKGTTKTFICSTLKVVYTGTTISKSSTKVKCTARWPTAKSLSLSKSFTYILGSPDTGVFKGTVRIILNKKAKQAYKRITTKVTSVSSKLEEGDPEFNPVSLGCPQENYFIWGEGKYESVLNTTLTPDFEECAHICSSNPRCFSWTRNGNHQTRMGLAAGFCRMFGYMRVTGKSVPGLQSGYHKCWD